MDHDLSDIEYYSHSGLILLVTFMYVVVRTTILRVVRSAICRFRKFSVTFFFKSIVTIYKSIS